MKTPSLTRPVAAIACMLMGTFALTPSAWACASCGCSLSSDWESAGLASESRLKLDIRYDYLNQNHLRGGTHAISTAAASQIVNDGENQEVERFTKNNYFTVGLDYTATPDWALNVQLPYIVRSHSTLGTNSDGTIAGPDGGQYNSRTASIGDVKLIGRYMGALPARNLALLFGLKLPTGKHTETGTSTDPTAPDPVDIDRGLQPGTGTTDVILGTTYVANLAPSWNYMVQALFQTALRSSDGYRPGNGINLNAGLRYTALSYVQPQLQLNVRHAVRDTGPNADNVSTGGTLAYLSPGVNVPLSKQASIYGYTQLPVYQKVNGVQLTPRLTASIGVRYAF